MMLPFIGYWIHHLGMMVPVAEGELVAGNFRQSNMAAKSQNLWRFLNGKSVAIDRFHPTTSQYLE